MDEDWTQFLSYVRATFPNADLYPMVRIPWGEEEWSGLIVDTDEDFRIGVYADMTADDAEPLALLEAPCLEDAVDAVEYLTEEQPEGTHWTAWAAQRIADWSWVEFHRGARQWPLPGDYPLPGEVTR